MSILTAEFAVLRGGTEYKTTGQKISEAIFDDGSLKAGDFLLVQRGTTKYKWQISGINYSIDTSGLLDTDLLQCVDGGVARKVTGAQFKAIIPPYYFARGVYHITNLSGTLDFQNYETAFSDTNGTVASVPLTPGSDYYVIGNTDPVVRNFELKFGQTATFQLGPDTRTGNVENMEAMFNAYQGTSWNVAALDTRNNKRCQDMFAGCGNWDGAGVENFDMSKCETTRNMFGGGGVTVTADITGWDVGNVESTQFMFEDATFNQDISGWDVSSVTTMRGMFSRTNQFNQSLNGWNVSNVTNMQGMFIGCTTFNGAIDQWVTSSATNFRDMFNGASSFNQDIGGWLTGTVTNMRSMFFNATAFDQDLSGWCVSNFTSKPIGFDGNSGFANDTARQPIWGTCP